MLEGKSQYKYIIKYKNYDQVISQEPESKAGGNSMADMRYEGKLIILLYLLIKHPEWMVGICKLT